MRKDVLQNLLTDCVRHPSRGRVDTASMQKLTEIDWREFLDLANEQRVGPLLYWRLRASGVEETVPVDTMEDLRQGFRQNGVRNLQLYADLHRMLHGLRAASIPVIVLKGAFLAQAVYEQIALREMNDVDLLVPFDRLHDAWSVFEKRGFKPLKPYTLETELAIKQHLPRLLRPKSPSYEIHGNLVAPGQPFSVGVEEFWDRAVETRIADVNVLALSAPDLMLHLCAHSSYSHQLAFGLRPYCDLAETIRHFSEDLAWEPAVSRAERLGWRRGVYIALRLAVDLVGAAVPQEVLERLQPEPADETVVGLARKQVFTDRPSSVSILTTLPQLWAPVGTSRRLRHFFTRLFSAKVIAGRYSLPIGSAKVLLYYPLRILDLLRAHLATAWRLWRGESALSGSAERQRRLASWLEGDQPD